VISQRVDALGDAAVLAASVDEPELFTAVFDRHFGVIHAYLARRVGADRADDLAAEVFRLAFQRRRLFRPVHESARPWLYGIASNLVLQDQRSELRRLSALARLEAAEVHGKTADPAGERADSVSLRRPLFEALARLEPRDRDVLLLVAWEGLSYTDVAAALEIPVGTVRSRLNRARAVVRRAFAETEDDEDIRDGVATR
jgi:RNA polymerase sigma factor (sigma-70 family)